MARHHPRSSHVTLDEKDAPVWQDRSLRFDAPATDLQLRDGEFLIDSLNSIEDTKGNNGERGAMTVTNLRLLWVSHRNPKTNLSVGYKLIQSVAIRMARSRLRGNTQALFITAKLEKRRFEFIFTSLVKNSPRLFTTTQAVLKAYESSSFYREIKLRRSIIQDGALVMLPQERVFNSQSGVWNLSSDQGGLGTMIVTNVRVVWHAVLAQNFNVSLPYMQIRKIKLQHSKFGDVLVIETLARAGGYKLGFRVDPDYETLVRVFDEINSLHQIYSKRPIFGVNFAVEAAGSADGPPRPVRVQDDIEIVPVEGGAATAHASYLADTQEADRTVMLDPTLGLAIESPPGNMDMSQLWNMSGMPINMAQ